MTITQLDPTTWVFSERDVRFFLLAGEEDALLLDCGCETKNARELSREVLAGAGIAAQVRLALTHADRDHIASAGEFPSLSLHPGDWARLRASGYAGEICPLWDGEELDLGDRPLRVIHTPGHTPGSVALLDLSRRRLFAGDSVSERRIFLFGQGRDLEAYTASLDRLSSLSPAFDEIIPSHGERALPAQFLEVLREAARAAARGEATGRVEDFHGTRARVCDMGCATLLLPVDRRESPADLHIVRARTEAERAGAYFVRISAMAREFHIPLEDEFDAHDGADCHYILLLDEIYPVATCRWFARESEAGVAEIGRVVVLPEYRGRALGRTVVSAAEEEIRACGYREVFVSARREAVGFYKKLGYTPSPLPAHETRTFAVTGMGKTLAENAPH